jgi:hypothetical protein
MRRCVPTFYLCLSAISAAALCAAPAANGAKSNADWPCQQILVGHISPAAVWTGPSIEGVAWSEDADIVDLAGKIAARRVPIDQAKAEIDAFAKAAGADKRSKLTKLFAALFDRLDRERSQVIEGLERFGHVQKAMADKIRAENESLHAEQQNVPGQTSAQPAQPGVGSNNEAAAAHPPNGQANETALDKLQWDLRLFQERRRTLNYVCEVPALIEQRLFALAREIQDQLD